MEIIKRRLWVHFSNDWSQLFSKGMYNWKNWCFVVLEIAYEDDIMFDACSLELKLLGLGATITYKSPHKTPEMLELERRLQAIEDGTAETVSHEEVMAEFKIGRCPRCLYKLGGQKEGE